MAAVAACAAGAAGDTHRIFVAGPVCDKSFEDRPCLSNVKNMAHYKSSH
jgi:hypothetical protein